MKTILVSLHVGRCMTEFTNIMFICENEQVLKQDLTYKMSFIEMVLNILFLMIVGLDLQVFAL